MTRDPLATDDPLAERRFAYGRAAAGERDFRVAAELFEQALERAPDWATAWFALGEAREKLGGLDAAAEAFLAALRCDPADTQGAAARLALLGRDSPPDGLPHAYLTRLFDGYAPRFDAHLINDLGYCAPALIAEALDDAAQSRRFVSALDLGCGTGLMGEAARDRVEHMTGVDLSPAMIARARERGVYNRLVVGEAAAALMREPPAAFDLIVAADLLVYIGDLAPLFAAVATALTPDGLFAFSVESHGGDGFKLMPTMRFAHARPYVETTAGWAGMRPLLTRSASSRREAGADVPGLICIFERKDRPR